MGATQADAARALFASLMASAAADVVNIRLGVHPDHTRVVLDLSAPAAYRLEPQTDPLRVVIALDDAGFRLTGGEPPAGHGLIKAIRIEQAAGAGSRMILELAGPAHVRLSQMLQASGGSGAIFFDLQPGQADGSRTPSQNPILPASADERNRMLSRRSAPL
jgi:N-acetylmuramoyl-L-alanine amidase